MKLTFAFAFNGGHLTAEVDNFKDADELLNYALKRGVITMAVPPEVAPEVTPEVPTETIDDVTTEVTAEVTTEVTVEDAQQAVKDYAAKNGIEAGRELLNKFGLKRTSEITQQNAGDIVGACNE